MKLLIPLAFIAFVMYALSSMIGGMGNCLLLLITLICLPMIAGGIAKGTSDMG